MIAPEMVRELRSIIMAEALTLQWNVAHPGHCNCERCDWQFRAALTDRAINTIGELQ